MCNNIKPSNYRHRLRRKIITQWHIEIEQILNKIIRETYNTTPEIEERHAYRVSRSTHELARL